jgi:hypothetical protein
VDADTLHYHPEGSGYPFVWLADGYLRAARLSEAHEAVARALAIARKQDERGHEAWALFTQAEIERANRSSIESVISAYDIALDIAELCSMHPLIARCHFGLALVDIEMEGAKEGSQSLNKARDSFSAMGMKHWLDQMDGLLEIPS